MSNHPTSLFALMLAKWMDRDRMRLPPYARFIRAIASRFAIVLGIPGLSHPTESEIRQRNRDRLRRRELASSRARAVQTCRGASLHHAAISDSIANSQAGPE